MNKKVAVMGLSVMLLFSGCSLGKPKPTYEAEKAQMISAIESKYPYLEIVSAEVWASERRMNGVKTGQMIGTFVDKNDPSFALQAAMQDDGTVNIEFSETMYKARIELIDILKKHKPGNVLNDYLEFQPEGVVGPVTIITFTDLDPVIVGVMRKSINSQTELEDDYLMTQEMNEVVKKYYPELEFDGIRVIHWEQGEFDWAKWKERSFNGADYWMTQTIKGRLVEDLDHDGGGYSKKNWKSGFYSDKNALPTRVLDYTVYGMDGFQPGSKEEFMAQAMELGKMKASAAKK